MISRNTISKEESEAEEGTALQTFMVLEKPTDEEEVQAFEMGSCQQAETVYSCCRTHSCWLRARGVRRLQPLQLLVSEGPKD